MFFAVSGFLITTTALRRSGSLSRVNVRDFYVLRFARIAPLLLLLLGSVPFLFVATIFCAAVLGDLVARFYSEPMNGLLRHRWRGKAGLGSLVAARTAANPAGV